MVFSISKYTTEVQYLPMFTPLIYESVIKRIFAVAEVVVIETFFRPIIRSTEISISLA